MFTMRNAPDFVQCRECGDEYPRRHTYTLECGSRVCFDCFDRVGYVECNGCNGYARATCNWSR